MSGLSNCVKSLRRFPSAKICERKVVTCIVRYKMHTAVYEEEKLNFFDDFRFESGSITWLHKVSPAFPVDGSKVTIIHEPSEFYNTLLQKCKTAKTRITLASLYLGTGKLEAELVKSIKDNIDSSNGNIKVNILLDYMRGSRGKINSKEMLRPLLESKFGNCCRVFLYHTPKLQGLLKFIIPDRFNELIGLQHMKIYLFDNTLIISGANLSNDYFKNRQDRYFMIEDCQDLCDFYDSLVNHVSKFSYEMLPDGSTLNVEFEYDPINTPREIFADEVASKLRHFMEKEINERSEVYYKEVSKRDTWVYPLIQMAQLNFIHDSRITLKVLESAPRGSTLKLATGYFNLTNEYERAILEDCSANCDLLTAHPRANGFFGAEGVAGGIPAAYTKIEESFYKMCRRLGQNNRIRLWEFIKPGWTYHAKGLWYSMPGESRPSVTFIGSPNFGYRSVERDLETQIALVTRNKQLQDSLQKEYERLFDCATPVTQKTFSDKERITPAWVRIAVYFFRYYF